MLEMGVNQTFTTREVVKIVRGIGRGTQGFDNDRLKEWNRRGGILREHSPGRGKEREYSFDELCFIGSLALLADHSQYLGAAVEAARALATAVRQIYEIGPSLGDVADACPPQLMFFGSGHCESIQLDVIKLVGKEVITKFQLMRHGDDGGVLVHPGQIAITLAARIDDVLAERKPEAKP